jgi:hypothetical protein
VDGSPFAAESVASLIVRGSDDFNNRRQRRISVGWPRVRTRWHITPDWAGKHKRGRIREPVTAMRDAENGFKGMPALIKPHRLAFVGWARVSNSFDGKRPSA